MSDVLDRDIESLDFLSDLRSLAHGSRFNSIGILVCIDDLKPVLTYLGRCMLACSWHGPGGDRHPDDRHFAFSQRLWSFRPTCISDPIHGLDRFTIAYTGFGELSSDAGTLE
jgi:hypothetical protein